MPAPSEIKAAIAAIKHDAIMCRAHIRHLQYTSLQKAVRDATRSGYGQTLNHFPEDFSHQGELIYISKTSYGHALCFNH